VIQAGLPSPLTGTYDIATGGNAVWAYNWRDHTVRAINPKTNKLEAIVTVAGFAPSTGSAIAADADSVWVVSTDGGSGILTKAQVGLAYPKQFHLRYDPLAVTVGERAVWVAVSDAPEDAVLRVDPTTGKVLAKVPLGGTDIESLAVGERAVWALQSGRITRIDPATNTISGQLNLPAFQVAQIAAGEHGVWATMRDLRGTNVLVWVDPRTLRLKKTIPLPTSSSQSELTHVAVGEDAVWWNGVDAGAIWRLDPRTGNIVSKIPIIPPIQISTETEPLGIAAGAGGVWVTMTIGP
jgi:streptogramin lyase